MGFLNEFLMSRIIWSVFIACVLGQLLKFFIHRFNYGKWDGKKLIEDGGMPSSHSATVSSLTTAIFIETGYSYLFVISLVFSIIVIRDAVGLRRAASKQAVVLNKLMSKENMKIKKLNEFLGHSPFQVAMGVILGIVISRFVYFLL